MVEVEVGGRCRGTGSDGAGTVGEVLRIDADEDAGRKWSRHLDDGGQRQAALAPVACLLPSKLRCC